MPTGPVDQLGVSLDVTEQVIAAIRSEQWSLPTPCPDWTVTDLVNHLVAGNHLFATALGEAPATPYDTGVELLDAYQRSAAILTRAFRRPGALEDLVTVPFGSVPGSVALHLRTTEVLVHGWDLAWATGQQRAFPDDLAAAELAFSEAALSAIPSDHRPFGPAQPVPETAAAIDRLAACLGRRVTISA